MLTGAAGLAPVSVPLGAAAAVFGVSAAAVAVYKFGYDQTHKPKVEPKVYVSAAAA